MGLFDNLFLDQNTPVTINDGVDHSKDVAVSIVEPTPAGTGSGQKDDTKKDDTKKDDTKSSAPNPADASLVDLFDNPDDKVVKAETTPPPPPVDIALEIGKSPVEDTTVSFDIGGDISFDIGGDMNFDIGVTPTADVSVSSPVPTASNSVGSVPETTATPVGVISSESPTQPPQASTNMGIAINATENIPSIPQNDAIFSLLNTESPASLPSTSESSPIADPAVTLMSNTPTPSVGNNTGFSLLDLSVTNSPQSVSNASEQTHEVSVMTPELSLASGVNPLFSGLSLSDNPASGVSEPVSQEMHKSPQPSSSIVSFPVETSSSQVLSSETPHPNSVMGFMSAPKLKEKISQFLSELETLEIDDQNDRHNKLHQIEICKMRIREIQAESERRIDALRHEILQLEREIQDMDLEKNRLKSVIQSFQKEIDATS